MRFVLVAAAYALSFALLRSISFSHWFPVAGFRLLCLLLVPYRYWPALVLGELCPLAYNSYDCINQFGLTWAFFNAIPPIAFAIPLVAWCRRSMPPLTAKQVPNVGPLLLCSLLVSVLWAVVFMCAYKLMRVPAAYHPIPLFEGLSIYFLGNFLGVLTVVPLALAIRESASGVSLSIVAKRLGSSRLVLDSMGLLLPILALLTWISAASSGTPQQVARIAMFIPVAGLALRYGWRGAAIGGSAANIAIVLSMPALRDPATLQAQAFMSFAIATMLLLGSRVSALITQEQKEHDDGTLALQLARYGLYLGEQRMRRTAYAIEQLGTSIQKSHGRLLDRLRQHLPAVEERAYYRQAVVTQHEVHRLADSMYPLALRNRGLPSALREGALARSLDEAGIAYRCDIQGRGLSSLAPSIHIALYRLACEAAVQLIEHAPLVTSIRLRLRGGETHGRRWAVLRLEGAQDDIIITTQQSLARAHLMPKLGANGLSVGSLNDQARLYGGNARVRRKANGTHVSLLIHDTRTD